MAICFLDATGYKTEERSLDETKVVWASGTAVAQGDQVRRLFAIKTADADHTVVVRLKEGVVTNPAWSWENREVASLSNAPLNPDPDVPGLDPEYTGTIRFEGPVSF